MLRHFCVVNTSYWGDFCHELIIIEGFFCEFIILGGFWCRKLIILRGLLPWTYHACGNVSAYRAWGFAVSWAYSTKGIFVIDLFMWRDLPYRHIFSSSWYRLILLGFLFLFLSAHPNAGLCCGYYLSMWVSVRRCTMANPRSYYHLNGAVLMTSEAEEDLRVLVIPDLKQIYTCSSSSIQS